jgi:hypothetical protein
MAALTKKETLIKALLSFFSAAKISRYERPIHKPKKETNAPKPILIVPYIAKTE